MLVILLFDFNGFIDVAASHITWKHKRAYVGLGMAIIFLLFDIFIYKALVNSRQTPEVTYATNIISDLTCEDEIEEQLRDHDEKREQIKKLCTADKKNEGQLISSQIVMVYIILVLYIVIATCTLYDVGDPRANDTTMKLLLSIPLVLLSCSVSAFAVYF